MCWHKESLQWTQKLMAPNSCRRGGALNSKTFKTRSSATTITTTKVRRIKRFNSQIACRNNVLVCIGAIVCVLLSCSRYTILSSHSFRQLATFASNQQAAYILQASLGNLLIVSSSCFWTGPRTQLKNMWQETSRRFTSLPIVVPS